MNSIFISYKREDEAAVGRLVDALTSEGLTPWWDRAVPGGQNWRANIQAALDAAQCVIVCWSENSVGPGGDFVRDEAAQAKERNILIPVSLDRELRPPLGFGEIQVIDLSQWRGSRRDPSFQDLMAAVRAKLEGATAPPAQGWLRRFRRAIFGGSLAAVAAALLSFFVNVMGVQAHVCAAPIGQPSLSDACGSLRLGDRPTRTERLAFDALPPGDCNALRAYRDRFEESPLRELVDSRLSAIVSTREEIWLPGERRLALFAGGDSDIAARENAAMIAAQLCQGFAATTKFRFVRATLEGAYTCEDGACGIAGTAVCELRERHVIERRLCGTP